jgi:hypothetical protein
MSNFVQAGNQLTNTPVCALCFYIGVAVASSGLMPRRDIYSKQLCELCGTRLSRVKHTRQCGPGRACHPRCKLKKTVPVGTALPEQPAAGPRVYRKRTYEHLGTTAKRQRRAQLRVAVKEDVETVGCPIEEILPSLLRPEAFIHLSTAVRGQIRSVPGLQIPAESAFVAKKKSWQNRMQQKPDHLPMALILPIQSNLLE